MIRFFTWFRHLLFGKSEEVPELQEPEKSKDEYVITTFAVRDDKRWKVVNEVGSEELLSELLAHAAAESQSFYGQGQGFSYRTFMDVSCVDSDCDGRAEVRWKTVFPLGFCRCGKCGLQTAVKMRKKIEPPDYGDDGPEPPLL